MLVCDIVVIYMASINSQLPKVKYTLSSNICYVNVCNTENT